jgi:hypothetical protein
MATPLLVATGAAIIGTTPDGILTSWNQSADGLFAFTT